MSPAYVGVATKSAGHHIRVEAEQSEDLLRRKSDISVDELRCVARSCFRKRVISSLRAREASESVKSCMSWPLHQASTPVFARPYTKRASVERRISMKPALKDFRPVALVELGSNGVMACRTHPHDLLDDRADIGRELARISPERPPRRLFFGAKSFLDVLSTGACSLNGALDGAFALAGLLGFVADLIILSRGHSFPILIAASVGLFCHAQFLPGQFKVPFHRGRIWVLRLDPMRRHPFGLWRRRAQRSRCLACLCQRVQKAFSR